ncbi:MAG: cysteine desulfurase family protein [Hyphomonadaceae bacterium]|nr:cysteine desulfurase family protein [Hyphomonadaceae bacterium]
MSPVRHYCDYNATAPLRPEAKAAMVRALESVGNPSSVHAEGRKARDLVEGARETVAAAIGACRDDIAFTSGGTEAVGLALCGAMKVPGNTILVASAIEHDAVTSLANHIEEWRVSKDGVVDLDWLRQRVAGLKADGYRPLVSLMLVNNESGVIQPVAEAAEITHSAGGLIHCDAIQALGKIQVSVIDLDVDYLSLSAHKIGGPQGAGATYVKAGAPFVSVQTGGGQEFGRRAGTENVAGIAGFAAAADTAQRTMGSYQALGEHRDRMEQKLMVSAPSLQIHGAGAARVAGVSCFGVEGLPSETQIMSLDLAGFAVSAGSACSSGKVKPSRVLTAMGLGETAARSAIRASFGWASAWQDFDALSDAWIRMAARARPALVKMDAHV